MPRRVAAFLLTGALLLGGEASAQAPPPGPWIVWGQRDLSFQTIIAGFPTSVGWNSSRASRWLVLGDPGSDVQLDFITLPPNLHKGAHQMPVSYSSTDAAWRVIGIGATDHVFDPNVGTSARFSNSGLMWVFLGGTAEPPPNQQAGSYSANVDLDISYTGK